MDKQQKEKILDEAMKGIDLITCNKPLRQCEECQRRVRNEIEEAIEKAIKINK